MATTLRCRCACSHQSGGSNGACGGCRARRERSAGERRLHPDTEAGLSALLAAPGEQLPPTTRADMESRFGRSFAGVRVHDGPQAASAAASVDASAFAAGNRLVFGAGHYAPDTRAGHRLLAHELAHVSQQGGADPGGRLQLPGAADEGSVEADADRMAETALRGDRVAPGRAVTPGVVARAAATTAAAPAPKPAAPDLCRTAGNAKQLNMGRPPGGRFDGVLDRSTCPLCSLTLVMRVLFNQANAWPDAAEWTRFKADYVRLLQDRWSNEYDFVPPDAGCSAEGCRRVSVHLNVVPVTAAGSPHWTVNVSRASAFIQSNVRDSSHTATLDSRDTSHDDKPDQIPAEHEAGHMLGMGHTNCGLNRQYQGDINAAECYGGDDVMGAGSTVTVDEYQVYGDALKALAPGCGWRPAITDARRRRNRVVGAVSGGILGALVGGAAGFGLGFLAGGLIGGIIGGVIGLIGGAIGGAFAGRSIGDAFRRTGEQ